MFNIVLHKDFLAGHKLFFLKAMMPFAKLLLIMILKEKSVWLLLSIKNADSKYMVMFSTKLALNKKVENFCILMPFIVLSH